MKELLISSKNDIVFGEDVEYSVEFCNELSNEAICELVTEVLDFDEANKDKKIFFNLKSLTVEQLTEVYRLVLKRKSLSNESIILNINILINGYNTLDDSLFAMKEIYVNGVEDLIDIKLDLTDEILEFQTELVKWFLASLKSMHRVEFTYLDTVEDVPPVFVKVMMASNFLTMSQIFSKASPINTSELPLVKGAYPFIASMASTSAIADGFISLMSE